MTSLVVHLLLTLNKFHSIFKYFNATCNMFTHLVTYWNDIQNVGHVATES